MVKLTKRLQACADLVRNGSRLADIGCDHGYVPVYLCENGLIKSAVASDINEAPLSSCRRLVEESMLEDRISCVLSDGLEKLELDNIDDILIAGVGGILIYEILRNCRSDKHLILNPMTHPEEARRVLYENGYEIENDIVVADSNQHYSVFDAYYTGEAKAYTAVDLWLGKINDFSDTEYFTRLIKYLKNKEKGGADYSEVIAAIEEKIYDDR